MATFFRGLYSRGTLELFSVYFVICLIPQKHQPILARVHSQGRSTRIVKDANSFTPNFVA